MNQKIRIHRIIVAFLGVVIYTCSFALRGDSVSSIKVDGWEMVYTEQGQGPLVVLVHGAVSDHRTWSSQQILLANKGYRVVAPTQRYFGSADWSEDWPKYLTRTHANDLVSFLRKLGSEKAHLVGWSSGVHIALVVSMEHPELVSSVFGYEPVVPSYVVDTDRLSSIDQDAGKMVGAVFEPMSAGDLEMAARRFLDGVSEKPGYFDELTDAARNVVLDNSRTLPLMFDGGERDVPISCAELAQIMPRITIAQGELSRPFFNLIAEDARRCLPKEKHLVVEGAKHMWPADNSEQFARAVDDAIQSNME